MHERRRQKWKQQRASKGTSKDELDLAADELFADVRVAAVDADAVSPTQKERAQQLLKMIPAGVKKLITDEAAQKSINKGRLTRKWILSEYERQVRKQKIQEDFCDGSVDNRSKEPDGACPVEIGDSDEQIECKTCRTHFEFTVGQQKFYHDKNIERKPEHCKKCTDDFKARMKDVPCKGFGNGRCTFGGRCRFSHADDAAPVEDADDAVVVFDLQDAPECAEMDEMDKVIDAAEFGTKAFNPYEVASAEIVDLSLCADEQFEISDDD